MNYWIPLSNDTHYEFSSSRTNQSYIGSVSDGVVSGSMAGFSTNRKVAFNLYLVESVP